MKNFFIRGIHLIAILIPLCMMENIAQDVKPNVTEEMYVSARDSKNYGKAAYYAYELGKFYAENANPDQAQKFLDDCISNAKKSDDDLLSYLAYQLSGSIYMESSSFEKASGQYTKGLKIVRALNRPQYLFEALTDLSKSYMSTDRHKRSLPLLEEALSIAIRSNDVVQQLDCYGLLIEGNVKTGDEVKAHEYQTLYDNIIKNKENTQLTDQQMKDLEEKIQQVDKEKRTVRYKLSNQSKALRMTEDSLLATKYSLEETEQSLKLSQQISENQLLQIDLLNASKQLDEIKIREQNQRLKNAALIRNFIIVGIVLTSALVIVLILSYRRKIKANKKIAEQNESIQSSINYAKRIQEAMLHRNDVMEELLPESFILYKPRDVVSGDFYWISEIKNWYDPDIVICAADCTGHGIPGAFMSMIGMNAINSIISQGIAETDQILGSLDTEIKTALQQEKTGNNDGMDVALCIYRKEKNLLEFSGAKNPLVYFQNNKMHQVKGDKHCIGGNQQGKNASFKKHIIPIDQPTTIYLYSDGYQDQFGDEVNEKFMSKKFKNLLLEIHSLPMTEQKIILDQKIEGWKGSKKQTDDILVMGIKLNHNDDE